MFEFPHFAEWSFARQTFVALIAYPIVWLILIPFRLLGIVVTGVLELVWSTVTLPAVLLRRLRAAEQPRFMPRTYSSIEEIRAELAWVNEAPDPNKCGCRHLRCCEETGHKRGGCLRPVATKFWTFRWEFYCHECREYEWCGSKSGGYMVAR